MRRTISQTVPTATTATSGKAQSTFAKARQIRSVRVIKRYPVLTSIIVMMIVTFIAGMATGFDLAVRLNYVLAILIAISWVWSMLGATQITARVERAHGPFSVGDTLSEQITIRNSSRTPKAWIEIEDKSNLPDINFREVASIGLMVTFKSIHIQGTLTQRGEYQIGPLVLRTSDPFGLFPREIQFEGTEKILIYPKIQNIPNFASAHIHMVGESSRRQRLNALSTDVSSVREYSDGDPIGRIHWLSTARTGNLMVKQFDQGSAGELWVLFDQHIDAQAGKGKESTDEYGATIAASTINRYTNNFMPVGYAAHGSQSIIAAPENNTAHRDNVLRHIAASKPTGNIPILDAIAEIDRELYISSTLVVITAAHNGEWITALASLQKRGVKVICVAMDRESFGNDSNEEIYSNLTAQGITSYRIKQGDNIAEALASSIEAQNIKEQLASTPLQTQQHNETATVPT